MRYRTKLYVSLVGISLASIALGLIIFSISTEKLLLRMLASRSLSVAATAAAQLDPQLFAKADLRSSPEDPLYKKAKRQLRKILNANRREDIFISEVYTLYPDPHKPGSLVTGVDSAEATTPEGTPYTDSDKDLILANLENYFTDPAFVRDQYGVWLSAYAPIRDAQGKYVATLGIDINASDIHTRLEELIRFAAYGLLASLLLSILLARILSRRVTVSLDHLCGVVKEIGEGHLEIKANLKTDDEFTQLADRINLMTLGLQERDRLKTSFARYVSKHILDKILTSSAPLKLEGERRKVTLLFSDIRQFTRLAERLPPEDVVRLLNDYFERMIDVIFSHFGTLDKFIGDGIMAEFGAPLDDALQEKHAIQAAIDMQKELAILCTRWKKENKPTIEMGIGIHTGEAVVGNIGSERRTEYTAIGDTVNVAARLEQATKTLKVPILISESTYAASKDSFPFEDLGPMTLPGRREAIRVFAIQGLPPMELSSSEPPLPPYKIDPT